MILWYVSDETLTTDGVTAFYTSRETPERSIEALGTGVLCMLHATANVRVRAEPISV